MSKPVIHPEVMKDLLYRWMALAELIDTETYFAMVDSLKEQITADKFSNQREYEFLHMAIKYLGAAQNPCDESCEGCGGDFSRKGKS